MEYKYAIDANYEDFSSGRVILSKAGLANFPCRLTCEIVGRCIALLSKKGNITIYDPCCGGCYLLTVAGLLYPDAFSNVIGSDISEDTLDLARDNLALLTPEGLSRRKAHLELLYAEFGRDSQRGAIDSCNRFEKIVTSRPSPYIRCDVRDCLSPDAFTDCGFTADIVIADVPYDKLTSWTNDTEDAAIDLLLTNITQIMSDDSVAAVICDKQQKPRNHPLKRADAFTVGHRKVEILRKHK